MRIRLVIYMTLAAGLLSSLAVSVEAQRRRRTRPPARQQEAPQSAAIAPALGELHWGMEPREVNAYFVNKIQQRYRERLSKAPGTIEEDRIRAEQDDEVARLRQSYTRFDGQHSGWDLSFLRGEFTQGNRESMLVYRDENSQNFYFFIGGRLWKWYKAFDASVFAGQTFEQFAGAVQTRFGRAVERNGRLAENGPEQHWLEWQDRTTRLRAIDHTHFYGFYCLVFEDKDTLSRLPQLRTNTTADPSAQGHALVESVVLPQGGQDDGNDANADIVDRLTGQVRHTQAPTPTATQTPQPGTPAQTQTPTPTTAPRRRGGTELSLDDL